MLKTDVETEVSKKHACKHYNIPKQVKHTNTMNLKLRILTNQLGWSLKTLSKIVFKVLNSPLSLRIQSSYHKFIKRTSYIHVPPFHETHRNIIAVVKVRRLYSHAINRNMIAIISTHVKTMAFFVHFSNKVAKTMRPSPTIPIPIAVVAINIIGVFQAVKITYLCQY